MNEALDVLALADVEEADEVVETVSADPLRFGWGSPVG